MKKITEVLFVSGLAIFVGLNTVVGQVSTGGEPSNEVYVQLKPGVAFPVVLGNSFLDEAYDLSLAAFMGEARVFFRNRVFMGIQGNFFKAEVDDISLVGNFDRTNIWHNYVTGGYSILPRNNKFGVDVGLGFGYTIYANRKVEVDFHEDGFSLMGNLHTTYRFSQVMGSNFGVQYTHDFLATDTAPELERFFKNVDLIYFSAGLVFYINQ